MSLNLSTWFMNDLLTVDFKDQRSLSDLMPRKNRLLSGTFIYEFIYIIELIDFDGTPINMVPKMFNV